MSKTKKRRVRKQRLLRLCIAIAAIAVVLVFIWQHNLGNKIVTVGGTDIRSGMVEGVEAFLNYIQTGAFTSYSTEGLTGDELTSQENMALVSRNSLVENVFIPSEVLKQHFAAKGVAFPNEEQLTQINDYVESYFGSSETAKTFTSNGVKKAHAEYYFEYVTLVTAFRDSITETDPVTDEQALEYYNEHQDYFATSQSMRASHILIQDPEHTAEKRAEIESILERIDEGEDFAELAMEYSEDSSAESGGDLGTFGIGQMVPEFEEACLALEPGEVSGIVETEYGFHIIKLTEMNEAGITPFDEARERIDSTLIGERATEALDKLVEEADIKYHELVNPTTGKLPISLTELDEARGITNDDETTDGAAADGETTDGATADGETTDG
ncbi:MAG: peptidylprolyl isomerase, partial [Acidobacteriota bacterium]|nr:peptidylprolyl isomerase [Acidobacteriota bacterium]